MPAGDSLWGQSTMPGKAEEAAAAAEEAAAASQDATGLKAPSLHGGITFGEGAMGGGSQADVGVYDVDMAIVNDDVMTTSRAQIAPSDAPPHLRASRSLREMAADDEAEHPMPRSLGALGGLGAADAGPPRYNACGASYRSAMDMAPEPPVLVNDFFQISRDRGATGGPDSYTAGRPLSQNDETFISKCPDGLFGQNFCSEWCNAAGGWECGEHTLSGESPEKPPEGGATRSTTESLLGRAASRQPLCSLVVEAFIL